MDGRPGPGTCTLTSGSGWPVGGKLCSLGVGRAAVLTCCVEATVSWPGAGTPAGRWALYARTAVPEGGVTSRSFLAFYSSADLSLTALSSHPCQLSVSPTWEGQMAPGTSLSGATQGTSGSTRRQTGSLFSALTAMGQSQGWPSLSCLHRGVSLNNRRGYELPNSGHQ